jgi:holo-[acyl-carrier protein] synthase
MNKILHGIDLVDCPRIEKMLERHGEHFLDRVFTKAEQKQADAVKNRIEKLAGRFAAKEAVLKMLGTGWRGKIAWTDIEIVNNHLGQPQVTLSGEVEKIASKMDIGEISLSISHTANFVMASAVATANEK